MHCSGIKIQDQETWDSKSIVLCNKTLPPQALNYVCCIEIPTHKKKRSINQSINLNNSEMKTNNKRQHIQHRWIFRIQLNHLLHPTNCTCWLSFWWPRPFMCWMLEPFMIRDLRILTHDDWSRNLTFLIECQSLTVLALILSRMHLSVHFKPLIGQPESSHARASRKCSYHDQAHHMNGLEHQKHKPTCCILESHTHK